MNALKKLQPTANPGASFLPEDYVSKRAAARANFVVLFLFVVVMFCVVGAFFVTNRRWESIRVEQQSINIQYTQEAKRIEQLKALEDQRGAMMEKAEITTALIERVPRSVLLAELITKMPEDLTLMEIVLKSKRIEPEKEKPAKPGAAGQIKTLSPAGKAGAAKSGAKAVKAEDKKKAEEDKAAVSAPKFEFTLTITGVGRDNKAITDYFSSLKTSPLFKKIDLPYIKETVISESEYRKFEIVAVLDPSADARAVAPPAATDNPSPLGAGATEAPASPAATANTTPEKE
jgi:hypothetical protein